MPTSALFSGATFTIPSTSPGSYTFSIKLAVTIAVDSGLTPSITSSQSWSVTSSFDAPTRTLSFTLDTAHISSAGTSVLTFHNITPASLSFAIASDATGSGGGGGTVSLTLNPDGSLLVPDSLPGGITVAGTSLGNEFEDQVQSQDGGNNPFQITVSKIPSGATAAFSSGDATLKVTQRNSSFVFQIAAAPGSALALGNPTADVEQPWLTIDGQTLTVDSTEVTSRESTRISIAVMGSDPTTFDLVVDADGSSSGTRTTQCYIRGDRSLEVWELAPGVTVSGASPTYLIQDPTEYQVSYQAGEGLDFSSEPISPPPPFIGNVHESEKALSFGDTNTGESSDQTFSFSINMLQGSIPDPTLINDPTQG